ncbi:MAG: hypothetical protein HPZ91_19720 [Lentisphaeria bacterium]|nr:hypothetical protein [Lentisphaeria bacterium]
MKRYEQTLREFRRDKFRRMLLGAVTGILLAYTLPMSQTTVFVGLYPATILLGMNRFSIPALLLRCGVILGGATLGTCVVEFFQTSPFLAVPVTFALFLGVLKLFALRFETGNAVSFVFTYSLGSIYASYPGETMEIAITEQYLIQIILIFFIVWGCFAAFPAQLPKCAAAKTPAPAPAKIGNAELMVYALIWLGIWMFFMLFEWRFALFAFLSFVSGCCHFERDMMKRVALENIIAHVTCCSAVALFSLLVLGVVSNPLVLVTGLLLVVGPVMYRASNPPSPEIAYRCRTMVSGILVPLVLYVGSDHAAVYQSVLRASLIILLMGILWLVVEYLHHGKEVLGAVSGTSARRMLGMFNSYMGGKHAHEKHDRADGVGDIAASARIPEP